MGEGETMNIVTLYCVCFIRQADSVYVKMENLKVNTSYNVSVSIYNAMLEYRHLLDMKSLRTLPSKTYHPQIIPEESIKLSEFTINENPQLLNVYVHWAPADGMDFGINSDLRKLYKC